MQLNEIEEETKNSNKLFIKNRKSSETNKNSKILKVKRMRDIEETINYYDIIRLKDNNNNYNDININEDIRSLDMSTSDKSFSISQNDLYYKKDNNEDKILQLKIDLKDQPYKSYFHFQNFY